jgi:L-ascorbate metabolism protein UlaG (beta-lactamase superfamily)
MIKVRLLRHATLVVCIGGKQFLIDPMLGKKDSYDPVIWTSNNIRNPMIDLPVDEPELLSIIGHTDAVLVSHTHNDHWDPAARSMIRPDKLIIGQPEDEATIREQGFENFIPLHTTYDLDGVTITRTTGQHGTGEIGAKMGPVSGFVLNASNHVLYIAGDTIWCDEVETALELYEPEIIILNAGAAQFDMGDPITMTAEDVLTVAEESNARNIVCVHMDAINHCQLKRAELRKAIKKAGVQNRCLVPADGEMLAFPAFSTFS